jgi:thiamine-monophosphate kinase
MQGKLTVPAPLLMAARERLERPTPRVALGLALRGIASAAIDVSDGLLGDLGHILESSQVGATVQVDQALRSIACYADPAHSGDRAGINLSQEQWRTLALAGGDDYELLFTASPSQRAAVAEATRASQTPVRRIGQIDAAPGLRLLDAQGQALPNHYASFDHFT